MTDNTERTRIEIELAHVKRNVPFPTTIAIASWNARVAALEARLRDDLRAIDCTAAA